MFGYSLPDNFNLPYISGSLGEFWRRWHISLSSWLRNYLYFPLGGNRKGQVRTSINLLIIMVLGGIWHGAAWSFAIWGFYHGAGLAFERLVADRFDDKLALHIRIRRCLTFCLFLLVGFYLGLVILRT